MKVYMKNQSCVCADKEWEGGGSVSVWQIERCVSV